MICIYVHIQVHEHVDIHGYISYYCFDNNMLASIAAD